MKKETAVMVMLIIATVLVARGHVEASIYVFFGAIGVVLFDLMWPEDD